MVVKNAAKKITVLEPEEEIPDGASAMETGEHPSSADMAASLQAEFDRRQAQDEEAQAVVEAVQKEQEAAIVRPKPRADAAAKPLPTSAPQAKPAPLAGAPNPFTASDKIEKRPKILFWGDSGAGKTWLALKFPNPVVIDMERGTELYGKDRKFHVVHTQDPDRVAQLVEWLRVNRHEYKTLVLDPITIYWEALQRKWSDIYLRRNKQSKGFKFEFYDFQPKDWMQIRDEYQALMRGILSLDMNVVVTAHAKAQYDDGQFMKKVGETFDSQKKTPYLFDVVVQLTHDPATDKHRAIVVKDRTQSLPHEPFEAEYAPFARAFGATIDKPAEPFLPPTANAIEEMWRLAREFGLSDMQVASRLETYGSSRPEELSAESIAVITGKLRAALAAKAKKDSK